ncbi:MAG: response regulator transcription factor [Myxococcota bacterium]
MKEPKRVLIVEDQELFALSLRASVMESMSPEEVRLVDTLGDAKRAVDAFAPDLVLLDLGLPDGSGLDLIDHVQTHKLTAKIVILTMFDDDQFLFDALRRGVAGYVLKEESGAELAKLLEDILLDRPPLSPSVARRVMSFFASPTDIERPALTEREETILQLLAKGCTIAEAARMLELSPHTVQHHVKNLYRKLDVHSRAEMTRAAVDMGIV